MLKGVLTDFKKSTKSSKYKIIFDSDEKIFFGYDFFLLKNIFQNHIILKDNNRKIFRPLYSLFKPI